MTTTLLNAIASATVVAGAGAQTCNITAAVPPSRRLQAGSARAAQVVACPGAMATFTYSVPIFVPPTGNVASAQNAVLALNAAAYSAYINGLVAASNCSNIAYTKTTITTTCGDGGTTGCILPSSPAAVAGACTGSNLGLCIGLPIGIGLAVILGAAAISYFYCVHGRKSLLD